MKGRELTPQLSQSSILSLADSHTEFFDACEVLLSASSSENEVSCGGRAGRWENWMGYRETSICRFPNTFLTPWLLSLVTCPDPLGLCGPAQKSLLVTLPPVWCALSTLGSPETAASAPSQPSSCEPISPCTPLTPAPQTLDLSDALLPFPCVPPSP